jgi:arginine transport system substrate-binding protein
MKSFFKKYFIFFAALIGFAFLVFNLTKPVQKVSEDTLIVGLQSGYPPFEFMDSQGQIIGFDVDLAKLISNKLGKTLLIKDMEFEGEILSLKQGKIDLIISGMNITHSRQKEILMIPYHGDNATSLSLVFWNHIPEGIKSMQDIAKLSNAIISVESGAIPETYMATSHPSIQAKSFQGALAPLMDVKYGKSMANLVEHDVALYLQKKHPEIKILNIPLDQEETIMGFGIGIKKENKKLYDQIESIIQELKSSGELQHLEDLWFKGEF